MSFCREGQRSVLWLLPSLELRHGYTLAAAVVVVVVVDTATPNWGWSCTSTFACCCCCFFVVLVAVAVAFCSLSFCFVAAFPNCCCCLFVSGRAVAAASLALISGFRASGCRGLQVYICMRVPCICMCVSLKQVCVTVLIHFLFGFTHLYCLLPRCTHICTLAR